VGRRIVVRVDEPVPCDEPDERVLLLGLPDPTATLETLTGACEAGASAIVLVATARSQGRAPAPSRIERILRAAQRQCGRPRAPLLFGADGPWPLARALDHRHDLPGWFAWEALSGSPGPELGARGGLRLLVGPEGGFTAEEVEQIMAAGLLAVSLGPWILRTPTAALALLARAWTGGAARSQRSEAEPGASKRGE
jgi:16S rRNA (uracil1498-N3)-methyltransferase